MTTSLFERFASCAILTACAVWPAAAADYFEVRGGIPNSCTPTFPVRSVRRARVGKKGDW